MIRLATTYGRPVSLTKPEITAKLKAYGIRGLKTINLSTLQAEDLRRPLFVKRKADPLLILPISTANQHFRGLLRRKEAPVRLTALRAMGITFDKSFGDRHLDTFVVMYCGEEAAVVVAASRLFEYIR